MSGSRSAFSRFSRPGSTGTDLSSATAASLSGSLSYASAGPLRPDSRANDFDGMTTPLFGTPASDFTGSPGSSPFSDASSVTCRSPTQFDPLNGSPVSLF